MSPDCRFLGISLMSLNPSYCLIGPNSCGKTTLISCILGTTKLESGSITVLGQPVEYGKKNKTLQLIGLMPQEEALIDDLNVLELLQFFAHLHGMSELHLATRLLEMAEFLEPIDLHSMVSNLSGGEKRKISFAIAIIHKPKLLILDEPSVCLDPLIRNDMWLALTKLSNEDGSTVLMTTHYYQETQNADRCGFMKNGIFLFEDSPMNICKKTNTDLIDEAVLRILQNPGAFKSDEIAENQEEDEEIVTFKPSGIFSFILFFRILQMEVAVFKRRFSFLFFLLMMQVIISFIYTHAVGGIPKFISLGIVENDDYGCKNFSYDAKCEFEGEKFNFL